jgi:WXG100 family type VII secretion target
MTGFDVTQGFDVESGALADASAAAAAATNRLRQDRDRLDAAVDGLLTGGWRGSAADSFRDCWDAWLVGAHDVIEGLGAMSSLLAATRLDYQQHDDDSQRRLDAIAGLIVERLG